MIMLNKVILHLISVDLILKLFDVNPQEDNYIQSDMFSIHLLHVVVLRKYLSRDTRFPTTWQKRRHRENVIKVDVINQRACSNKFKRT